MPKCLPATITPPALKRAAKPADDAERIRNALLICAGDRDAAARHLGISRTTLWRKLR